MADLQAEDEKLNNLISVELFKDMARIRNIKAIYCLILFWAFIVLTVIAVFSYVEIQVYRFEECYLFAILYTACLGIYIVLYYSFSIVIYIFMKPYWKKIYDRTLVRNIQSQLTLNLSLPVLSAVIIIIRWISYSKLGNFVPFGTPQGYLYGCMSYGCFILALCGLLVIVTNTASFYNVFIPPSKRQMFFDKKFIPNEEFDINSYKTDDGRIFYTIIMK